MMSKGLQSSVTSVRRGATMLAPICVDLRRDP
jgi:hypothetical protein